MLSFLIFITLGVILCFFGIRTQKFSAVVLGIIWGFMISILLFSKSSQSLLGFGRETLGQVVLLGTIISAVICGVYQKVCAFISSFTPVFLIVCVLVVANGFLNGDVESISSATGIAFVIALVAGIFACIYSNGAFIIECAFTGALMIMLGLYGTSTDALDLLLRGDELVGQLLICTLILACIGAVVQFNRYDTDSGTTEKRDADQWYCYKCGAQNDATYQFCASCGQHRDKLSRRSVGGTWTCKCGNINEIDAVGCSICGRRKISINQVNTWACSCGEINETKNAFCPTCGSPRNTEDRSEKDSKTEDCSVS